MAALAFRAIALASLRPLTDTTEPHCQRATDRKLTTGHWITSITSFWFKPILKVTLNIPSVF
jgi:hypothetical protein